MHTKRTRFFPRNTEINCIAWWKIQGSSVCRNTELWFSKQNPRHYNNCVSITGSLFNVFLAHQTFTSCFAHFSIKTSVFEKTKIRKMLAMLSCSMYILRDSGFCFSKLQNTLEMRAINFKGNWSGELQMMWLQSTVFSQMTTCSGRDTEGHRDHEKHFNLIFFAMFV